MGAIEYKGHPSVGKDLGEVLWGKSLGLAITDDAHSAIDRGDVLIEFTTPESTMGHLRMAFSSKKAKIGRAHV